jgi:hypothetical protein
MGLPVRALALLESRRGLVMDAEIVERVALSAPERSGAAVP